MEWLVPMPPGLVRLTVVPWKSDDLELAVAGLADHRLVRCPELGEAERLGGLDRGDQERTGAVGLLEVDREAEVDVLGLELVGLAVDDLEAGVHLGQRLERLDDRPADEVRERHLAASSAGEVVVDHDAVVEQQLDRDRAHARRGGDGQAGVHVGDRAGRGSAQHDVLDIAGPGLGGVSGLAVGRCDRGGRGGGIDHGRHGCRWVDLCGRRHLALGRGDGHRLGLGRRRRGRRRGGRRWAGSRGLGRGSGLLLGRGGRCLRGGGARGAVGRRPVAGAVGQCRAFAGLEERHPGGVDRSRVVAESLVHLFDEPLVGAEIRG